MLKTHKTCANHMPNATKWFSITTSSSVKKYQKHLFLPKFEFCLIEMLEKQKFLFFKLLFQLFILFFQAMKKITVQNGNVKKN